MSTLVPGPPLAGDSSRLKIEFQPRVVYGTGPGGSPICRYQAVWGRSVQVRDGQGKGRYPGGRRRRSSESKGGGTWVNGLRGGKGMVEESFWVATSSRWKGELPRFRQNGPRHDG